MEFHPIAHIETDFGEKFGIPRQSGLVSGLRGKIVFEPQYRNPDALRGIEGYSHLWLVWLFSQTVRESWLPMVRPPRLGGNTPMGVFATRSPFRPNPIGLSSVRLLGIEDDEKNGKVLWVEGADLMTGTPILDSKPYLAYTDSHPDAVGGFSDAVREYRLAVEFPEALAEKVPMALRAPLLEILAQDPRPSYQEDPERPYGFSFAGLDIRFRVKENMLTVFEIVPHDETMTPVR